MSLDDRWVDLNIVGPHAEATKTAARGLFRLWERNAVAVPGGQSLAGMDQTLIHELQRRRHPGLVLFSSGSTGEPKAALHDVMLLRQKFMGATLEPKTLLFFLLFDHIGGINTLLHARYSGSKLVALLDRSPEAVAKAIDMYGVQVLPTTPTFLRLLLLSGAITRYDLSSLELITYGTEPMPASTLEAITKALPHVRFKQTYGLSELGILATKSKTNDSTWLKLGRDCDIRVVNGLLEIRAPLGMMGYLNAPSPFTEDGWFKTGDAVEVDGEWLRILGRQSDIINVGGLKVYPAEIESALQSLEGVESAVVSAEANPITGQMVRATVKLSTAETADDFRRRMRRELHHLAPYTLPQCIDLATSSLTTARFKKERPCSPS